MYKRQDLKTNGMGNFLAILEWMEEFQFIEFGVEDIVRSTFVKKYIIAKNELDESSNK